MKTDKPKSVNNMKKFIIPATIAFLFLSSCTIDRKQDHEILETSFLFYYVENNEVIISGLTELGQLQETIIVPAKIDGLPVTYFGRTMETWGQISSSFLKKIIFLDNTTIFTRKTRIPNLSAIVFSGPEINPRLPLSIVSRLRYELYAQPETYAAIENSVNNPELHKTNPVRIANVLYLNNYLDSPNNGYFMVDSLQINDSLYCPFAPIRPGYSFTGWFLDSSTTLPVVVENFTVFDDYISLYAGWVLN